MKTLQNIPSEDVKYASFFNSYLSSPFALIIDRSKMSLVLTVRGTMSFDDCVKDVIADAFLQQILLRSKDYDVIATLNLNGDYASDALAAQVGGIGILVPNKKSMLARLGWIALIGGTLACMSTSVLAGMLY